MNRKARWTVAAILGAMAVCGPGLWSRPGIALEVTYIANEGFLISSGGRKIMIDAVFKAEADWCVTPSDSTLGRMAKGQVPFDGIDLFLFTHHHVDHFSAPLTISAIKANPAGRTILTSQALEILAKEADFPALRDRVVSITPRQGTVEKFNYRGVEVTVLGTRHSPYREADGSDRHAGVRQNGYLIKIGGKTILHLGDASVGLMRDIMDGFRLADQKIDILFYQCDGRRESVDDIQNRIKPEIIVAMHLHPSSFERTAKALTIDYPQAFFFKELMEKRIFE